jgi:hypothetical protein
MGDDDDDDSCIIEANTGTKLESYARRLSVITRTTLCSKADCLITGWTDEVVDLWLQIFVQQAPAR